jgi:SPX domain protein involved in polyphosphate accumulation
MEIIERYEYKFLVEDSLVPAIRSFALSTSRLDAHARADGAYAIRSLYFDTAAFDLYAANEHEVGRRFKVRARTYPDSPGSPVFLEVKRRFGDVISKSRAAVPRDLWRQAIECDETTLAQLPERARSAVSAFACRVHLSHLEPVVLVEYEREAYVSEIDSYARLTFDRNIRVQAKSELDLEADPHRWCSIDHAAQTKTMRGVTVLELKFERRPPAWMHAMVRRLELVRYSFSKYCYGVFNELVLPNAGDRASLFARQESRP